MSNSTILHNERRVVSICLLIGGAVKPEQDCKLHPSAFSGVNHRTWKRPCCGDCVYGR